MSDGSGGYMRNALGFGYLPVRDKSSDPPIRSPIFILTHEGDNHFMRSELGWDVHTSIHKESFRKLAGQEALARPALSGSAAKAYVAARGGKVNKSGKFYLDQLAFTVDRTAPQFVMGYVRYQKGLFIPKDSPILMEGGRSWPSEPAMLQPLLEVDGFPTVAKVTVLLPTPTEPLTRAHVLYTMMNDTMASAQLVGEVEGADQVELAIDATSAFPQTTLTITLGGERGEGGAMTDIAPLYSIRG